MVVDADALNLIAAMKKWPPSFKAHAVLTPHPGEMGRLVKLIGRSEVPTDEPGRIDIATEAARAFGQLIVLKGSRTIVTDGARLYINDTGDSSLSKAGTGDILSGIIGTLLSQKLNSFDAATLAVWLHGKAGEIAGKRLGNRCVLARDVIEIDSCRDCCPRIPITCPDALLDIEVVNSRTKFLTRSRPLAYTALSRGGQFWQEWVYGSARRPCG